jgi:hypothetical protein
VSRGGDTARRRGAGAGGCIDKTYLVHYGFRESLTHRVRFLRGLVGEEAGEVRGGRRGPRGHRFAMRRYGVGVVGSRLQPSERTATGSQIIGGPWGCKVMMVPRRRVLGGNYSLARGVLECAGRRRFESRAQVTLSISQN